MSLKFNITIDINDYEDLYEMKNAIIDEAADKFLQQVFGVWDEGKSFKALERRVVEKMEKLLDSDFKKSVAEKVTENLTNKFEKTKQYKLLKEDKEVLSDGLIKTGLRGLVGDIVRSEMKKVFK
jgi:signal recognition particle GTPase